MNLKQVNNVNAIQQALTIDLVAINESLIRRLMIESEQNVNYSIEYYNGLITHSFVGYLVSLTEEGTFNDTLKLKLTFGVANV